MVSGANCLTPRKSFQIFKQWKTRRWMLSNVMQIQSICSVYSPIKKLITSHRALVRSWVFQLNFLLPPSALQGRFHTFDDFRSNFRIIKSFLFSFFELFLWYFRNYHFTLWSAKTLFPKFNFLCNIIQSGVGIGERGVRWHSCFHNFLPLWPQKLHQDLFAKPTSNNCNKDVVLKICGELMFPPCRPGEDLFNELLFAQKCHSIFFKNWFLRPVVFCFAAIFLTL